MQAAEILFAIALGVFVLGEAWPRGVALAGSLLVMAGIIAFAWVVARQTAGDPREVQALRTDRGS
jgi:hypothetical protein